MLQMNGMRVQTQAQCDEVLCNNLAGNLVVRFTTLRRWLHGGGALAESERAHDTCPRPSQLWDDIMALLPDESPARPALRRALHCDVHDLAAVRTLCVPWVLDPACELQSESVHVRQSA